MGVFIFFKFLFFLFLVCLFVVGFLGGGVVF